MSITNLSIKIFADGADKENMLAQNNDPLIKGLTTNPTLMHKTGIKDYEAFAREILESVQNKPVSFEVFSEDWAEMKRQAKKIASWQENVFVKIPITNSQGASSMALVKDLAEDGIQLNITAVMTKNQVELIANTLRPTQKAIVSIFAGRIADTGRDPKNTIRRALEILTDLPSTEVLWASTREVFNIVEADACGCHIITVPDAILAKARTLIGTGLEETSLETVRMFEADAKRAGFDL